uniref:CRAL-TRIO domain-containing protein n=1 Tax=Rhizophora mucronata TaxID=61149 RepID=A0A2P2IVA9_RHIMU
MSEGVKNSLSNGLQKALTTEEQQAKINEVRRLIGQLSDKLSIYCSDASITRHLKARSWNIKKAIKMLKETLKWRAEYKPEEIRWEEVAHEAETGKIYRASYTDKLGRTVLVMRPSCQNTKSTKGQIKYLVYCLENAILNLPPNQEQMVWLIDFHGFNLSNISLKVTRETAHILQDHYPERLGLAILYNPPKFFEPFWMAAKAFLDPKTYKKVKFVYFDEPSTMKIMEDVFDIEQLEYAFGGKNNTGFDIGKYAERMKEDDKRIPSLWTKTSAPSSVPQMDSTTAASLDSLNLDSDSDASSGDKMDSFQPHEMDSVTSSPGNNVPTADREMVGSEETDKCEDAIPKNKAHA